MGYTRKDVEKTKKIAKKFVRYAKCVLDAFTDASNLQSVMVMEKLTDMGSIKIRTST